MAGAGERGPGGTLQKPLFLVTRLGNEGRGEPGQAICGIRVQKKKSTFLGSKKHQKPTGNTSVLPGTSRQRQWGPEGDLRSSGERCGQGGTRDREWGAQA